LQNGGRWQYGKPPVGNANFAWVQHFLYHLSPTDASGFVLSNGSLSSNTSGERDIRKALVLADLVDCIVMLPTQLFYNTGIPDEVKDDVSFEGRMSALTMALGDSDARGAAFGCRD
jgi:type I restriction enzyme M protein